MEGCWLEMHHHIFFSVAKYITLKLFLKFVLQTQSDIFITENLRVIYKFFQEKRNWKPQNPPCRDNRWFLCDSNTSSIDANNISHGHELITTCQPKFKASCKYEFICFAKQPYGIELSPKECWLKKKMHNLKVVDYVLLSGPIKDLSPEAATQTALREELFQRGKGESRVYKRFCNKTR